MVERRDDDHRTSDRARVELSEFGIEGKITSRGLSFAREVEHEILAEPDHPRDRRACQGFGQTERHEIAHDDRRAADEPHIVDRATDDPPLQNFDDDFKFGELRHRRYATTSADQMIVRYYTAGRAALARSPFANSSTSTV